MTCKNPRLRLCGAAALTLFAGLFLYLAFDQHEEPNQSIGEQARRANVVSAIVGEKPPRAEISLPKLGEAHAAALAASLPQPARLVVESHVSLDRDRDKRARSLHGEFVEAMATIQAIEDPDERRLVYREFYHLNREVMDELRYIHSAPRDSSRGIEHTELSRPEPEQYEPIE